MSSSRLFVIGHEKANGQQQVLPCKGGPFECVIRANLMVSYILHLAAVALDALNSMSSPSDSGHRNASN